MPSVRWTLTCGDWSTSGPGSPIRTSRRAGRSPGTSACSTTPGETSGYSAARRLASTFASSPGHRSSGTGWSQGRRRQTIPTWPTTGICGVAATDPHSARPCCDSYESSKVAARCVGVCCYTPTANHKAHTSGNNGSRAPARRCANTRLSPGEQERRTNAPQPASYTPTANAETPAKATTQHFCPPASPRGLLEPVAWKAGMAGSEGAPAQQCAGATRRAMVPRAHRQGPASRSVPLRARPHRRDRGLPRRPQQRSQTLHLDRDRRRHPREGRQEDESLYKP